jgi:hypothetical protein
MRSVSCGQPLWNSLDGRGQADGLMAGTGAQRIAEHQPWLLSSLQSPGQVLGNLGPNWFASVMGTGIVATAAATLPIRVPGLQVFAQAVWVLAGVVLVVLSVAVAAHWVRHPTVARSHAHNPQMAHFYGAAPMALLTVGAGAVLVGGDLGNEPLSIWTGCCGARAPSADWSPR